METNDNFDRIMEMNTEAERRKIAAMAMQGLLANPYWIQKKVLHAETIEGDDEAKAAFLIRDLAEDARELADALMAELNKRKDE